MSHYDEEYRPRRNHFNIQLFLIALLCTIILLGIGLIRFRPDLLLPSMTVDTPPAPAPIGNVGGQAPAVVRGTNSSPRVQATAIPGIAQNEAEGQVRYDAAVRASEQAPQPAPLPLNSAGAPIIDVTQQQQQQLALELAAQEALQAQRAAQLADAYNRAPDVSYEDAKALLGRDPCHVPRADPATCSRGLYKPTPTN